MAEGNKGIPASSPIRVAENYVEINPHVYVTFNPEGNGLMLCVSRGLACENHTQVLSVHTSNTPDLENVRLVVEELKEALNKQYNQFCLFVQTLGVGKWPVKEAIGLLFFHHLLCIIAAKSESLQNGI